jgi:hypothetical protein
MMNNLISQTAYFKSVLYIKLGLKPHEDRVIHDYLKYSLQILWIYSVTKTEDKHS